MEDRRQPARRVGFVVRLVAAAALLIGLASAADASFWIDGTVGEVKADQKVIVANPAPVQLLVEFQRDGASFPKPLKYLKPIVEAEVKSAGVVGAFGDEPVASGARLSVIVNDIPDKGAAGKGALAGLTFGLKGALAGDDYDVIVTYTPAAGATPITRTVHHRLAIKIGNAEVPAGMVQVKNADLGVRTVMHQTLAHGLNEIAGDPGFRPAAAIPDPTAPPTIAGSAQ